MGDAVQAVCALLETLALCGDWSDDQKDRFKEQFYDDLISLAMSYESELEETMKHIDDSYD